MGLFLGGLTFWSFFVYQIVGLIFRWAKFQMGLLSGVYGIFIFGNFITINAYKTYLTLKPPRGEFICPATFSNCQNFFLIAVHAWDLVTFSFNLF